MIFYNFSNTRSVLLEIRVQLAEVRFFGTYNMHILFPSHFSLSIFHLYLINVFEEIDLKQT
jgi:hypothetical protein